LPPKVAESDVVGRSRSVWDAHRCGHRPRSASSGRVFGDVFVDMQGSPVCRRGRFPWASLPTPAPRQRWSAGWLRLQTVVGDRVVGRRLDCPNHLIMGEVSGQAAGRSAPWPSWLEHLVQAVARLRAAAASLLRSSARARPPLAHGPASGAGLGWRGVRPGRRAAGAVHGRPRRRHALRVHVRGRPADGGRAPALEEHAEPAAGGAAAEAAAPAEGAAGEAARARAAARCSNGVDDEHRLRNRACMDRYRQVMIGMAREPGVDVVFGANDGVQFEPAVYIGYWKRVPHHTRVLVEPVPSLFAKLSKNLANLTTAPVLINKAVKTAGSSDSLDLYCFDTAMVDDWVLNGRTTLPEEVRKPEAYWNALCSTEKQQLLDRANILRPLARRKMTPADIKRVLNEVDKFVRLHHVPAASPADIIAEVSARGDLSAGDIKYVQIDVEGMDKDIMLALPFGKNDFLPKVVLYEGCYQEVSEHLNEHGYESCCCVNVYGTNTLAYRP
ncbi:unnamed protein product, partial [Prorocentrum cordatum]